MVMETPNKKNGLELAMIYEHLICAAFNCGRCGIWFADAGYFRGRNDSEQSRKNIRIFLAVALKAIITYHRDKYSASKIKLMEDVCKKLDYDDTVEWGRDCIETISVDEAMERLSVIPDFW